MKRVFLSSILIAAALAVPACSGGAGPDGNTVQVGNGDAGTLQNAEIPTEFASAAEALDWGKRLLDRGETARSIDVLLEAVKMDPDLAEAYFHLGIAYSLVEADDQSVDATPQTTDADSDGKKPSAKKKNSEKAFESAADAYKKILKNNNEDDVAHYYLGLTYNKLNEDMNAARSLREAVKLKPDNSEYQTELGAILIKLAKYHEAVSALKKAVELDPENIEAQELLEKAEAGKKRIDFDPPDNKDKKQDDKQKEDDSANSNSNANVSKVPPPSNVNAKSTPKPAKTPTPTAKTPRP